MKSNIRSNIFLLSFIFIIPATFFISCSSNRNISVLEGEKLFDINYGLLEDEINIFRLSETGDVSLSLVMDDGFFYILNGESTKIMEMNNYGDLITLFYNEDFSPAANFSDNTAESSTQTAVSYNFYSVDGMAVDSRKYLYVLSKLPGFQQEFDSENNQVLNQVIYRFDENNNYANYIGQNGLGGEPFPYVKNIYTTDMNELVVICGTPDGFCVYWYASSGNLLYRLPITAEILPNPFAESGRDIFISLENIIPDTHARKLYFKADYFENYVDSESNIQAGVDYLGTFVHPYDVEEEAFNDAISIAPYIEYETGDMETITFSAPYDFLGVARGEWLFFIMKIDDGFDLHFVNTDGTRNFGRKILSDDEDTLFYTFNLSKDGIISSLEFGEENCSVVWWRTDRLLTELFQE